MIILIGTSSKTKNLFYYVYFVCKCTRDEKEIFVCLFSPSKIDIHNCVIRGSQVNVDLLHLSHKTVEGLNQHNVIEIIFINWQEDANQIHTNFC